MSTATLKAPHWGQLQAVENNQVFSFVSGERELLCSGIARRIETPAGHGEQARHAFSQAVAGAFEQARQAGQANPIVVGALPFDAGEPSCLFVPEHAQWRPLTPVSDPALKALPSLLEQRPCPDAQAFKRSVEHALVNFQLSDVRKAVLSVQRELVFAEPVSVEAVQHNLRVQNPVGYHFRVPMPDGATLLGVSPELLVRKEGTRFVSNPLAGSAMRMADADADRRSADALAASDKDHHEHRFVTEDIAARIGELCTALDVPARPSLISTPALWHLSTRIEGTLADPTVDALQLACRLHPTPAVCGHPTERARHLIRFVESAERGLFTGMVGWCDAQGNGEWVVTIRCGTFKGERVRLFAGAGIVDSSQPDAEWTEVQTKLRTMLRACGLAH
ncbi:isochorismate synthase [Pseudomonas entomophila]|jgi:isochorismate synthase|uniref:isochorismate synthase n=1 Tax=Pseudomonas entomophila TaxID=312306 RepID=UPI0015E3DE5B|nr:isochorismate synthase [Pseudomonas entomophila]MBA1191282.1 isochorismate synthase [Pseudomonas entomophila]